MAQALRMPEISTDGRKVDSLTSSSEACGATLFAPSGRQVLDSFSRFLTPMTIRLVALDLDGTLLDSRGELSERNRAAIASARTRGVSVALVTGRRFRDARP